MGKREKKTGKGRLDRYYKLAKEQGYRARSAFKLIQLDAKFDFLKSARCLIDLCAAPGGWLQVASKYMPPQSIILGVDLVPIKPIPRAITFAEDITTDACRRRIRDELKDWRADVVLHDGAPNVGTAWAQDAFTQSELVLSSLKLATEFLAPQGTFVTKVFRSKDYNSLLWVFNQLFSKVEATKPPSSRNVSAEIFVVCSGYLAPKRIDPKLLNPTHVFKDLDVVDAVASTSKSALSTAISDDPSAPALTAKQLQKQSIDKLTPAAFSVFHPDKKRRAREGYNDGDFTLFNRVSAAAFVRAHDPIAILGSANQLDFDGTDEDRLLRVSPVTNDDVKASASDLKVLGKRDFKALLRWRTLARSQVLGLDTKQPSASAGNANSNTIAVDGALVETTTVQAMTEEEQMALDIERLENEDASRKRRERRKVNERKTKEIQRMQLHMTTPMDLGAETAAGGVGDQGQDFMFDLDEVEGHGGRTKRVKLVGNEADAFVDDDGENLGSNGQENVNEDDEESDVDDEEDRRYRELEANLDELYDDYQNQKLAKDAKHRVKEARKKRDAAEGGSEWAGIRSKGTSNGDEAASDASQSENEEDENDDEEANTLAYHEYDPDAIPADELDSEDEENSEDAENRPPAGSVQKRTVNGNLLQDLKAPKKPLEASAKSRAAAMWFDQPVFKDVDGLDELMNMDVSAPIKKSAGPEKQRKGVTTVSEEPSLPSKKRKGKHAQTNPDTWDEDEDAVVALEEANATKIATEGITTAEAMTLAQQLVNREKTKTELITDGFNRHAFVHDKEGLPTWFLDDEMKHFRHNIPVTKEAVDAIRAKMRALDARPIKKVAEAKARKKMRTLRRMAKMHKKAEGINDADDITEQEKASQIQKVLASAGKEPKKKKSEMKIVVARGASKGVQGRPKGVKGRYKMVDSRGKKEMRALKRIQKRDGGSKRKKY